MSVAKKHGPRAAGAELEKAFEEFVFLPALGKLSAIPDSKISLSTTLRQLKEFLDDRQLPHLGPHYTRYALTVMGWKAPPPDASWVPVARHQVWAAQGLSVGTFVRTERIMAWVSATLWFRDQMLEVPGRLFHAGIPPDADKDICAMLQPTFRHMARDDHAERAALLWVTAFVLNGCRAGTGVLGELVGAVRLYISHFPCLSCVAVLGQFARHMPMPRFEVAYDDAWEDQ
mmetsp:Transcript_57640/g.106052  ORF Transcript_57640/g.106052 Transcript_57640/m.106052 type:complete len:230 (+) Transcript_57640:196-885(+)